MVGTCITYLLYIGLSDGVPGSGQWALRTNLCGGKFVCAMEIEEGMFKVSKIVQSVSLYRQRREALLSRRVF